MKIEISSILNFIIKNGKIISINNEPFYVEKNGNTLAISDDCANNNTSVFMGNNLKEI